MNKDLIIKYQEEFQHWLNDGKLLSYTNNQWFEVSPSWDWNSEDNTQLVVVDDFIELRKALIEGKTVQCCGSFPELTSGKKVMDKKDWYDVTSLSEKLMTPDYYRIK